jgi:hypothetical protein
MHKTWSETVAELSIKNAGRVPEQLHAARG